MKKHILSIFAMATMLFATGCSEEENLVESNQQNATFQISLEGAGAGSRALSDGSNADKVYYAVYETGKDELLKAGSEPVSSEGTTSVNIPLVNGLNFDIVFFAHHTASPDNSAFVVPSDGDLTNLKFKTSGLFANQETYDAFYHVEPAYQTNSNTTTPVTLKRPLAQLNVATTAEDLQNAADLNATVIESKIVLKGIPTSFNARTGVAGSPQDVKVTFDKSAILIGEKLNCTIGGEDKEYNYLAMTYVLANEKSALYDSYFEFYRADGDCVSKRSIPNLPLQRNYRTNITGSILTQQENFSITLDTEFGQGNSNNHNVNANDITVESLAELNTALAEMAKVKKELILNVKGLSTTSEVEINIPDNATSSSITLNLLDLSAAVNKLKVSSELYAGPVVISIPNATIITSTEIDMPESHVTLKNGTHTTVYSSTSGTTLEVAGGTIVETLVVNQGNVAILNEGQVTTILRGENNDSEIVVAVEPGATLTNTPDEDEDIFITPSVDAKADKWILTKDVVLDRPMTIQSDKKYTIDLNGYTISYVNEIADKNNDGKLTSADNVVMFDVRGTLNVKNGTVTLKHTGDNYGWNACTDVFYVAFNGVLNIENATIENLGGTDMAYAIDLVNAAAESGITLNVNNSILKSTYIPVRVFNNATGMNHVNIKNSTLEGTSRAFWVHVYSSKDNGDKGIKDSTLDINIYNPECNNKFIADNPNRIIEYGFNDEINFDAYGYELIAEGVSKDLEGNYLISSVEGLKWLADEVNNKNTFESQTVKLIADIDLLNEQWIPIGNKELAGQTFNGTFNGNGYTISNLKHYFEGEDYFVGLFGCLDNAIVQDLTITNVDIKLSGADTWGHIGAVAGWAQGTTLLQNITVNGTVKIEGEMTLVASQRIGAVVGGNQGGNISFKDVTVNADANSYVKGHSLIGGIAGQLQGESSFENCSSNINVTANEHSAGGIIGVAPAKASFVNCRTEGNTSVINAPADEVNWIYRVGGIIGSWAESTEQSLTLNDCSYKEGTLVGKNTNGETATTFDCGGYVGRGWNTTIDVIYNINGKNYVYKGDGLYLEDNTWLVTNAASLCKLSEQTINGDQSVKLLADIDLTDVEFNGLSAFNSENPNTFDGQNHTVSNWTYESGASDMGFIKSWTGTIKDVKFDNCSLKTAGRSAVVAANVYANIKNVTVNNCSIEDSYWACGIIAGLYNSGSISNCSVTNSSVKSNGGTGGIVGVINESAGVRALTECSVLNSTIHNTGIYGESYSGGGLIGIFNVDGAEYKIERCKVENNKLEGGHIFETYPTIASVSLDEPAKNTGTKVE